MTHRRYCRNGKRRQRRAGNRRFRAGWSRLQKAVARLLLTKIKTKDLPTDLLAFVRRIWKEDAERAIWQDGDRYIMDTTLQHVEFTPEGKGFRMRVWGRHMDTRVFDPAIDRAI